MAAPQTDPQYKLRLPADLKERIAEAASAGGRSLNAEIVGALARAYPKTGSASDLLRDLFGMIIFNEGKFAENDLAVMEELFGDLQIRIANMESVVHDINAKSGLDKILNTGSTVIEPKR